MRYPTKELPAFLKLLNLKSKQEVTRHCANLTIYSQDLTTIILAAQQGVLSPYRYANHFSEKVADHLSPTEAESMAIRQNGIGKLKTNEARKFTSKIFQLFHERRILSAHLLYTTDHKYWHLLYFDNRDTQEPNNHWKNGSHIHYISDLWSNLSLQEAWSQITSGNISFPSKIHIKYKQK